MRSTALMLGLIGCGSALPDRVVLATNLHWPADLQARGDIDGDGRDDQVSLGLGASQIRVLLQTAVGGEEQLDVPIDPHQQLAVCPGTVTLRLQARLPQPGELIGSTPPGYQPCADCAEIVIGSGDCDPLHLYWNPLAQRLAGWRL